MLLSTYFKIVIEWRCKPRRSSHSLPRLWRGTELLEVPLICFRPFLMHLRHLGSGFSELPGGHLIIAPFDDFGGLGSECIGSSSTEVWAHLIIASNGYVGRGIVWEHAGLPVKCIKDSRKGPLTNWL